MISNLPDPILHLILSRLSTTEEVTRTSILSTQWRYLWTSVPFVDLDYSRGRKPFKEIEKEKFKEFVDWVLVSKSFNLDSFRLRCWNHYSMSTISRWICAAVARNIKSLHLNIWPKEESENIELPRCLGTCGSLVELRLFSFFGWRLILPKCKGFLAIRVLELNDVELFNDDLVNDFFKCCPLLEELSLIDCVIDKLHVLCILCPNLKSLRVVNQERFNTVWEDFCSLKIFCPKLVFFEFGGDIADSYSFESLGSLKKVVIHLDEFPHESMQKVFCELLVGSSLVESLSTSCHTCCDMCSIFVSQYKNADVPVFLPNLKTLELTMDFDEDSIDALIQILACFPHLKSLQLNIEASYHGMDVSESEEAETMRILTSHLKRVEFLSLNDNCEGPTLHTARLMLEHANALEEMVFRLDCDEANFHKMSTETIKEVSNFQKASPTVKLVTLLKIK